MMNGASIRGADRVAATLAGAGIRRLFTLSGNHIMSIFDASLDADIELIHVRHEAAAVHMADAWSRLTGQVGVALLTGGPGHANGLSALYTARMSESALLLLSGHAPLGRLGSGAFQELAQADMAAPVVKAAWTATRVEQLGEDIARGLRIAAAGRPGPVHISLPVDLLDALVPADRPPLPEHTADQPRPRPLPEPLAREFAARLAAAQRPLILTGPFASTAAAGNMTAALRAATGIPVIGMESPRGLNDPARGAFTRVVATADCVLLLGKQPDFTLGFARPPTFARNCRLLQIDPDSDALERLQHAADGYAHRLRAFRADVGSAAETLIARFERPHANAAWRDEVEQALRRRHPDCVRARGARPGTLHPAELCRAVQTLLDAHPDAVLICDGGEFGQWAQACLHAERRLINGPAGAIGSALPFAVAARLACPRSPVFALLGDGTCGFHPAEFDTALRYGLSFVAIVGNDACWNAEHQIQLRDYGPHRQVGCELHATRYDRVAAAFGGHGEFVSDAADLPDALARALNSGLPACVNVAIERVAAPAIGR